MSRGDLSGSEWRVLKELLPIEAVNRGRGASGAKSCNHQRYILGTSLRYAVAGCSTQIRQLEYNLSTLSALNRSRGGEPFQSPLLRSWLTVATTASIAPRFAPIFRQRAEKGFQRRALGGSRDGFTSKLHCLADARGRPLAFHLTVGRTADCKAYDPLISLPEQALQALIADKGHDADAIRNDPASRNIDPFIPGRANRRVKIEYDRTLYKQRNLIEQINCAIATRYDQLAENFISRVHIATARYWLKFVHAA